MLRVPARDLLGPGWLPPGHICRYLRILLAEEAVIRPQSISEANPLGDRSNRHGFVCWSRDSAVARLGLGRQRVRLERPSRSCAIGHWSWDARCVLRVRMEGQNGWYSRPRVLQRLTELRLVVLRVRRRRLDLLLSRCVPGIFMSAIMTLALDMHRLYADDGNSQQCHSADRTSPRICHQQLDHQPPTACLHLYYFAG